MCKFRKKAPFLQSFGRVTGNPTETAFPQNFRMRKLDEITVFDAMQRIVFIHYSPEKRA